MVYGNYFTTENSIQGHLRKKKLEEKDGRLRLWLEASAAYPVAQNTEYQVMRIDSLHGVKPTTRYWDFNTSIPSWSSICFIPIVLSIFHITIRWEHQRLHEFSYYALARM